MQRPPRSTQPCGGKRPTVDQRKDLHLRNSWSPFSRVPSGRQFRKQGTRSCLLEGSESAKHRWGLVSAVGGVSKSRVLGPSPQDPVACGKLRPLQLHRHDVTNGPVHFEHLPGSPEAGVLPKRT